MNARTHWPRSIFLALAVLTLLSCLRPMEERAERDREVGHATHGPWEVTVEDGLAAVRSLDDASLRLWASAPSFVVRIQRDTQATDDWELNVLNVMPDAQLEVLAGDVEVVNAQWLTETRVRWILRFLTSDDPSTSNDSEPGEVRLSVAPPDADRDTPFRFAVLSDIQEAIDRVQDIFVRINEEPDMHFLLGAGDLTQRGSYSELVRFQRELETLRVPYYTTLGNHELGVTPVPWHELFGRASFRFTYHDTQFTMLDSGSATIDPIVYDWLEDWLDEGRDRLHVLATHVPPVDPIGVRNGSFASRNEAAKLLGMLAEGRVDLTLYGHIHSYYTFFNAGIEAFISGGGGAIPEKFDGMGRHFLVVDADPRRETLSTRVVQVAQGR